MTHRSDEPSRRRRSASVPSTMPGLRSDRGGTVHKYWHYAFVASLLTILLCVLALLNAYLRFYNLSSYSQVGISRSLLLAGYIGMFLIMWISPIPDYILVPVYGYLSALGLFDPYTMFLICLAAALVPVEYACGRLAGRPLLLKGLSYFRITEKDIVVADKWVIEHGKFSMFTATFIPFFYSVAALAAGTLKMKAGPFFAMSTAGFGLRYIFLEYVGYYSIYIFTAPFLYSYRTFFALLLILSSAYAALYLVRTFRSRHRIPGPASFA